MKNRHVRLTIFTAILALIAGIFIGLFLANFTSDDEHLGGTIGKVDRYRNVKVTEDDVLLRNELVDDTAKNNHNISY